MIPRLTFLLIAAFWVAMNVLLWRVEYDSHGLGMSVPPALVWHKMLTAPDISSLNIFQDGKRTGFCEFSTGVEREMASLDESKPLPAGFISRKGYQIHFSGNVSLGAFSDRLTFNGRAEFSRRQWRKFDLKLSTGVVMIEIHSLAADQKVHLKMVSAGRTNEEVFSFAELRDPDVWLRSLTGNFGGDWTAALDLPVVPQRLGTGEIHWEAHSVRLKVDRELVPAYRLDTRIFDRPVVIYVSTLGEILRVELPGGVTAAFDQFGAP